MKLIFLLLFWLSASQLCAQNLPVIHSTIDKIDIREGAEFSKGEWSLAFELKPDLYGTNKIGERVTFYTDSDSISWVVEKDEVFDFIIVKGSDSAWTRIQYEPSKLDILKQGAEYNYVKKPIPHNFTYQAASSEELIALRTTYKLDSIAGNGSEITQIINLMHWVHDLIPHDGQHGNPDVKNAMSLIPECKKDNRGLNCRGLAIVLNECYLAMGFPSRHVTCMPKDSIFDDCHVINMVFSKQLNKWIWMDPTNDAYVQDENGQFLSIEEVRERLISGKPLVLNLDANWNHKEQVTKEYYLEYYMAKNLYRFSCPLESTYDYETRHKRKVVSYVELNPLNGCCQTPTFESEKLRKSKMTWNTYRTNCPEEFWTLPLTD